MRVRTWVDFGQEVDVEIGVDDIRGALSEAFATVTSDRLGEPGPNRADISLALNQIAQFLKAITPEHIALLSEGQRLMVADFLNTQVERFRAAANSMA